MHLDHIASLLTATIGHLRHELGALGVLGVSFHPARGEWCANEAVGHLIEADRRGFSGRVKEILAAERPRLEAWDQPAVAEARNDCARSWEELLTDFERDRRAGVEMLLGLTEADLDRAGLHPQVGELTVRDVVHEWPFHDRDHLKQILENTRQYLWPDMGGARGFSET